MLTPGDLATVRAALLFWYEEMAPHGVEIMQPYFDSPEAEPLSAEEVSRLRERFVPSAARYALYSAKANRLASLDVFPIHDEPGCSDDPHIHVVTLLLGG